MALYLGAVSWSAVCDCDISLSYSKTGHFCLIFVKKLNAKIIVESINHIADACLASLKDV